MPRDLPDELTAAHAAREASASLAWIIGAADALREASLSTGDREFIFSRAGEHAAALGESVERLLAALQSRQPAH